MFFKIPTVEPMRRNSVFADKGNTANLDHVLSFQHSLSPSSFDVAQLPTMDLGVRSRARPTESVFGWQQQTFLPVVEEDEELDSGAKSLETGCSDASSVYGGSAWFSRAFYKKAVATRSLPQVSSAAEEEENFNSEEVIGGTVGYTSMLFKAKSLPSITLTVQRPERAEEQAEYIKESASAPARTRMVLSESTKLSAPAKPQVAALPRMLVPVIGPVPPRSSCRNNSKNPMNSDKANIAVKSSLACAEQKPAKDASTIAGQHKLKPLRSLRKFIQQIFS